jgi:hypothetical protein
MKRRILTLVPVNLALPLPHSLLTNNIFGRSYIGTNNNDTLSGAIRFPSELAKNATFSFLKVGSQQTEKLSPLNIRVIRTKER